MKQKIIDKILARKRKAATEGDFASLMSADDMLDESEAEAKTILEQQELKAQADMIRPFLLAISAAEIIDPVLLTKSKDDERNLSGNIIVVTIAQCYQ